MEICHSYDLNRLLLFCFQLNACKWHLLYAELQNYIINLEKICKCSPSHASDDERKRSGESEGSREEQMEQWR